MSDILDIDKIKRALAEFANVRDWNQFHNPKNLSMAIACEAGELLEIFRWIPDVDSNNQPSIVKEHVSEELADILTNVIRLADLMNINLATAIEKKMVINNQKYPAELVKGQCKKHSEYSRAIGEKIGG